MERLVVGYFGYCNAILSYIVINNKFWNDSSLVNI